MKVEMKVFQGIHLSYNWGNMSNKLYANFSQCSLLYYFWNA